MIKDEEKIITKLSNFGLTQYEAQAYVSLLQNSKVSAYEISKNSAVPQSKIYESVKKLVERGLVIAEGNNPVKYSALPINEFLDRYQHQVEENAEFLKENLNNITKEPVVEYMWHFNGRSQIINKTRKIINKSVDKLSLELWAEELSLVYDSLQSAENRGVDIVLVLYGEKECDVGRVYYHEMEGMEVAYQKSGRWLTVLKDREEALFGILGDNSYGVWTQNKGFMMLAESFISHDIYIAEIYDRYREELNKEFGANLRNLRQKVAQYL